MSSSSLSICRKTYWDANDYRKTLLNTLITDTSSLQVDMKSLQRWLVYKTLYIEPQRIKSLKITIEYEEKNKEIQSKTRTLEKSGNNTSKIDKMKDTTAWDCDIYG